MSLSLLHRVHDPEGDVDPLFLGHGVSGEAVEPVLLRGALHEQEGAGEQREADELAALLAPELEHPHAAEGDGGDGRVAAQRGVRVGVPAAHVVAVPVQVEEGGVELVPRHGDEAVQQVEQLGRPVQVFVKVEAGVVVVAGAVPMGTLIQISELINYSRRR